MQSAEHKFRHWMRLLIVLFIAVFAYVVIADRAVPMTTEGRVQGYVVQVAPQVSGPVVHVWVRNNQKVRAGDVLFEIDPQKYRLAKTRAQLQLDAALEKEQTLYAQKEVAKANIAQAQASYTNAHREYLRLQKLSHQHVISQSAFDQARAQNQVTLAALSSARQNLRSIEAQLGAGVGQSTAVQLAKNSLAQAELDLIHTQVRAPSRGVVTNLQVDVGTMAKANVAMLSFVPEHSLWVAADFREKSVAQVNGRYHAYVTFDALPGEVFSYDIASQDFGVAVAQQTANGALTKVESNNRWVRDAQRIRVNLSQKQMLPAPLFVGSRATVVLYPDNGGLWSWLARIQIGLASWFHYIY
ncbi:Inner membrane protein YiaV [Vibrio stylophorae]|uniref:Inner membrane protein YiaV n=1 Tax=Vibrio stylophorae TaxID=659351 RepID=A0ABM8ZXU0_9VIBR|nr:HlyD family secretion protein [Vibrio stylophorae]CAH0535612.1 Inner membrane protein YiaV [Vibrio stylophorae]